MLIGVTSTLFVLMQHTNTCCEITTVCLMALCPLLPLLIWDGLTAGFQTLTDRFLLAATSSSHCTTSTARTPFWPACLEWRTCYGNCRCLPQSKLRTAHLLISSHIRCLVSEGFQIIDRGQDMPWRAEIRAGRRRAGVGSWGQAGPGLRWHGLQHGHRQDRPWCQPQGLTTQRHWHFSMTDINDILQNTCRLADSIIAQGLGTKHWHFGLIIKVYGYISLAINLGETVAAWD